MIRNFIHKTLGAVVYGVGFVVGYIRGIFKGAIDTID